MEDKKLSKQEIYDKVVRHLLTQKKKAVYGANCVYRAPDGCACAIGGLFGPDVNTSRFEGLGVRTAQKCISMDLTDKRRALALSDALAQSGVDMAQHMELLSTLQRIHDYHLVELWFNYLRLTARDHGLSTAVLDEFR